jgi:hypothetical protein
MRESYKRFVNPWIHFILICQFSKDSIRGFVLYYGVQKICCVDSFRPTVFKRFVLWIYFVRPKIPNYSIHFDLEGFIYDSRIHTKDPYYYLVNVISLSLSQSDHIKRFTLFNLIKLNLTSTMFIKTLEKNSQKLKSFLVHKMTNLT